MSPEKIVLEEELPFYTKLNSYFTSSLIIKPQVSFQPPPQGCETGAQNKLTLSFQAACPQRSPEINCKLLEINKDPVLNAAHSPGDTSHFTATLPCHVPERASDTQQMPTHNLYQDVSIINPRETVLIGFSPNAIHLFIFASNGETRKKLTLVKSEAKWSKETEKKKKKSCNNSEKSGVFGKVARCKTKCTALLPRTRPQCRDRDHRKGNSILDSSSLERGMLNNVVGF